MSELSDFIEISKYAGERFDLVQAGGGNSSVKDSNGNMYIKASGVYLSEIEQNYGYALVDNKKILEVFEISKIINENDKKTRDKLVGNYINSANLTQNFRPSIETLLHSLLKKYTLHTHPIVVNAITNTNNWQEILKSIFNDLELTMVDYKTPGIELALALKNEIKNKKSKIIFLQNHGLIVTSDYKHEIIQLIEEVLTKIEYYLNVDMQKYKLTNEVSKIINRNKNANYIAYMSQDEYINKNLSKSIISTLPFCPDKMVYCGVKTLNLTNNAEKELSEYEKKYFETPKVILYKGKLFFIAKNIKKAKGIEDVFKFHIMTLNMGKDKDINYLSQAELEYLGDWEAEKFRSEL